MFIHRSNSMFILSALVLSLLGAVLFASQLGAQERAVELQRFIVEPLEDGRVHIEWGTGAEQDTAGFYIMRDVHPVAPIYPDDVITLNEDGSNVTFVGATGTGSDYLVFDENAVPGETYTYVIVEQDVSGNLQTYFSYARTITIGDIAQAGIAIAPNPSIETTPANTPITHTITVTNTGNRFDTMIVEVDGNKWPTTQSSVFVPLSAGQSKTVDVIVTPPMGVSAECGIDEARVKVESTDVFNSTAIAYSKITTKLPDATYCLFLPITITQ